MSTAPQGRERLRLISFGMGGERYGLPLEAVEEVASAAGLRGGEGVPEGFCGELSFRGTRLAVMDLGERLGLGPVTAPDGGRILVSRGFGERPLGMRVDRVHGVREVEVDALEPLPLYFERSGQHLRGIVRLPEGLTLVLHAGGILSDAQGEALARWGEGSEPAEG